MKHNELRSIAHNLGDSLASGVGLLIGFHEIDVYGEAAASPAGSLTIDILAGRAIGTVSTELASVIERYRDALPLLCKRHGRTLADFDKLIIRFWVSNIGEPMGRRFTVILRDSRGRESQTEYGGVPAQRINTGVFDPRLPEQPCPFFSDTKSGRGAELRCMRSRIRPALERQPRTP